MRRAATEGGRTYIVDIWSERLPKAGSEAEYIYYIGMSEQRTRSVAAAAAKLLPQPPKQYIYQKKISGCIFFVGGNFENFILKKVNNCIFVLSIFEKNNIIRLSYEKN